MAKIEDSLIQDYKNKNLVTIALFTVFILILILKSLHFIDTVGPILNFDEFIYKQTGFQLYNPKTIVTSYHYPPAYPALIGLSSFFGDSFFQVILLINIFITTLPLFLAYWFLKKYVDRLYAFFGAVICSAIPMNFFQPGMVMSENLYYPLFMLVVFYFIFYSSNKNLRYSIGAGALFALLHLTRYITLPLLPFFGLIWIFDDIFHRKSPLNIKLIVAKSLLCLISYFTVYSLWIFINLQSIQSLSLLTKLFGLGVTESQNFSGLGLPLTFNGLLRFISYYLSYYFMMIGPVIYLIIANPVPFNLSNDLRKLYILTFLSTFVLIFVASWHSWRCEYNYPETFYIMGRYITFLSPLAIIIGYIHLFEANKELSALNHLKEKKVWTYIRLKVSAFLAGSGLIYLSYKVIYCDLFENLKDWFIMKHVSPDAYVFKLLGMKLVAFVIFIMLFFLLMDLIKFYVNGNVYRRLQTILISTFTIIYFVVAGYGTKYEPDGLYDKSLKYFIETYSEEVTDLYLAGPSKYFVKSGMDFWNFGDNITLHQVEKEEKIFKLENGLLLSFDHYGEQTVGKCNILNTKYYITRLPIYDSSHSD
jgi:4-amino-4-deoxy-L-arabinose transferase-like glycosyltransferase